MLNMIWQDGKCMRERIYNYMYVFYMCVCLCIYRESEREHERAMYLSMGKISASVVASATQLWQRFKEQDTRRA